MDAVLSSLSSSIPGTDTAARIVGGLWTNFIRAWGSGMSSLTDALDNAVGNLHTTTASGLGSWAAEALTGLLEGLGLEPPAVFKLRPALVNTSYVAASDGGVLSVQYLQIKQTALNMSSSQTDLFSALTTSLSGLFNISSAGDLIAASITVPFGDTEIPLTLALPTSMPSNANDIFANGLTNLSNAAATITGTRSWQ